MEWEGWKKKIIETANSEFAHIICREAKESDFNWHDFRVYFEQGLSAYDALETDLSRYEKSTKH